MRSFNVSIVTGKWPLTISPLLKRVLLNTLSWFFSIKFSLDKSRVIVSLKFNKIGCLRDWQEISLISQYSQSVCKPSPAPFFFLFIFWKEKFPFRCIVMKHHYDAFHHWMMGEFLKSCSRKLICVPFCILHVFLTVSCLTWRLKFNLRRF